MAGLSLDRAGRLAARFDVQTTPRNAGSKSIQTIVRIAVRDETLADAL
jgi:hypothetical protein